MNVQVGTRKKGSIKYLLSKGIRRRGVSFARREKPKAGKIIQCKSRICDVECACDIVKSQEI